MIQNIYKESNNTSRNNNNIDDNKMIEGCLDIDGSTVLGCSDGLLLSLEISIWSIYISINYYNRNMSKYINNNLDNLDIDEEYELHNTNLKNIMSQLEVSRKYLNLKRIPLLSLGVPPPPPPPQKIKFLGGDEKSY
eukprot:GHVR01092153.1.p1 GENE.GHVR01092153.1~~GHVR01092153.1.p1  ORF type:complete len:136 (+),score=58.28 GHVR01092153.1:489-896(+)